jgi:hypothetical protein
MKANGGSMKNLLFTVRLKPGTLTAYKKFAAEITGPRKQEYSALLKRYGLRTAKVWHGKIADCEYVFILHEAEDDALELLKGWSSSTHPFDHWFGEYLSKCYEGMPEPTHLLFEFGPRH